LPEVLSWNLHLSYPQNPLKWLITAIFQNGKKIMHIVTGAENPKKIPSPETITNALVTCGNWAEQKPHNGLRASTNDDNQLSQTVTKEYIASNGGSETFVAVKNLLRSKVAGAAAVDEKNGNITFYADPTALAVAKHAIQQESITAAVERAINGQSSDLVERGTNDSWVSRTSNPTGDRALASPIGPS
jgi:hypothetical protein